MMIDTLSVQLKTFFFEHPQGMLKVSNNFTISVIVVLLQEEKIFIFRVLNKNVDSREILFSFIESKLIG